MGGFSPKSYTQLEISAATGFPPPDVEQIATFLGIKKAQYHDKDLDAFQQFKAMLKEQKWTVNQAIAAHRAEAPAPQQRPQPEATGDAFNQTSGYIHQESNEASSLAIDRRAASIKHNAQRRAGDIETATNLLTTMYLASGNYDDPIVEAQVAQSEQLLEAQITNVASTSSLGKLLAATGIPGLQALPAIASAQESLKLLGNGPD